MREETDLEIDVGAPFFIWHNEFPPYHRNAGKKVFLVGFQCKFVSGEVKLSDEHDNYYRWVNKSNYRAAVDGTDYFRALEKYFSIS